MGKVVLSVLAVFLGTITATAAPDCSAILQHGLWNNRFFEQSTSRSFRAKSWYCNYYRNNSSDNSDTGLILGIDDFNLDFRQSQDFKSLTVKEACAESSVSDDQANKVTDFWSTASKVIVDAWTQCIKQQSAYTGFKVWVDQTSDPKQFNLEMRYDRPSAEPVKISRILVSGANCESTVQIPFKATDNPYSLGQQGATAICDRCPLRQTRISIASSELPNGARDTSSVITIPPAPDKPIGICSLALQVPRTVLRPSGRCVQGGDTGTRNCDAEGCDAGREITISAVEGGELREQCFEYCKGVDGSRGNPCAFINNLTVNRVDKRTIKVTYSHSSYAVSLIRGFTEWAPVEEPALETRVPVPVFANSPITFSWPRNAIDVKLSCNVGGVDTVFDPRATSKLGPVSAQRLSETPLESLYQVSLEGSSPYANVCKNE